MSDDAPSLSSEEVEQTLEVLDTVLERGYDVEDVEEEVLERAHEKLEEAR